MPTTNICITGGEPFTQPQDLLHDFAMRLLNRAHTIDVFTNGTRAFAPWATDDDVCVVMDWKLRGSGEANVARAIREMNLETLKYKDFVKFVVTGDEDLAEAVDIWKRYADITNARWCVGAAWDKIHEADLVHWVIEQGLPWNVNVQVHKFIFDPQERQI